MSSPAFALSLRRTEDLDRYIAEVSKYPLLDREQEMELARKLRDSGDIEAAHTLVVSNLRFVVKIAHGYKGYGLKLLDLVQEGNMGLMHAVKKFDPERGYRLISYAVWWIKAHIQAFIMRSWSLVRLGSGRVRRKLFFKLRSERAALEREAGQTGEWTREDLADRLGVETAELDEMESRLAAHDFSLDAPLNEDGAATHLDQLEAGGDGAVQIVEQKERRAVLDAVLASDELKLNDKERYILDRRLLADEPPTLAEIGKKFGVSRERVRQLEARLLNKLRAAAAELGLAP